jgi:DNA-binding transcriptional LysR family regulator
MLPLLRQCYESALGARSLAASLKSGEIGALRLALSHTIDVNIIIPQITELSQRFRGLELKFLRGTATEVAGFLKRGDAELALAAPIEEQWERLDGWPLFTEGFDLILGNGHRLANRKTVEVVDLQQERFLVRTFCEQANQLTELLRTQNIRMMHSHELTSERDLPPLLEANAGIAFVPRSTSIPSTLIRAQMDGIDLRRTVYLYGVAGRQRTAVANTAMKLLRSFDWSKYGG